MHDRPIKDHRGTGDLSAVPIEGRWLTSCTCTVISPGESKAKPSPGSRPFTCIQSSGPLVTNPSPRTSAAAQLAGVRSPSTLA